MVPLERGMGTLYGFLGGHSCSCLLVMFYRVLVSGAFVLCRCRDPCGYISFLFWCFFGSQDLSLFPLSFAHVRFTSFEATCPPGPRRGLRWTSRSTMRSPPEGTPCTYRLYCVGTLNGSPVSGRLRHCVMHKLSAPCLGLSVIRHKPGD